MHCSHDIHTVHVHFILKNQIAFNSGTQYNATALHMYSQLLLSRLTKEKEASPQLSSSDAQLKSPSGAVGKRKHHKIDIGRTA